MFDLGKVSFDLKKFVFFLSATFAFRNLKQIINHINVELKPLKL